MSLLRRLSSSDAESKKQSDWSRMPAAKFASVVLGVASIGGLAWSWNRAIERDALQVANQVEHPISARLPMELKQGQIVQDSQSPDLGSLSAIKRIDLNAAGLAELDLLPGIGPALASRIIADRDENGPYDSIDDLQRVKGIGPKTVEKIRKLVILGDSAQMRASVGEDG